MVGFITVLSLKLAMRDGLSAIQLVKMPVNVLFWCLLKVKITCFQVPAPNPPGNLSRFHRFLPFYVTLNILFQEHYPMVVGLKCLRTLFSALNRVARSQRANTSNESTRIEAKKEKIARKRKGENHATKKATKERTGEEAGTKKAIRERNTVVSTVERKAKRVYKMT